jgi:hypothetical protein
VINFRTYVARICIHNFAETHRGFADRTNFRHGKNLASFISMSSFFDADS